ncbi:phage portal protein [Pararhizobium haloflavum]|uniref:phage portal protein n=1 Tax=Pararhizobium haloflavum TaxID=2037914 RepID=UPI000C18FD59|nr:phage portal protein [Pararhizobium haloflavum]
MLRVPQIPLKRDSGAAAPTIADSGLGAPAHVRSEFMRGGRGVTMSTWRPALRDVSDDVAAAWDAAAGRAVDVIQNSGWIAGAIEQAAANTVGNGLRLRCMPENELFGMSEADAQKWRKLVEQRFSLWANNPLECDIEGRRTIGQMQDAAFRQWFATGEILAEIVYRRRYGSRYGTKVRLLSPHKLSRTDDPLNRVKSGVKMNADGLPIAYVARRKHPLIGEYDALVPARDALGRPAVILVFQGLPGQVRGISPLTPGLKVAKQFDQLADATLLASLIQTVFAAAVQSDAPTEDILQGLLSPQEQAMMAAEGVSPFEAWYQAQAGWYDGNSIDVGMGGRIAQLFPGQKMEFLSPNQPTTAYKDFSLHLLRELARCLGLTYESATGDYSDASYSSVRMAGTEIFAITSMRRKHIVAPLCQPIYEAWLEEAIENGDVPFPGGIDAFLANRTAACRAEWPGAPKPQADDLKSAKAHEVYRNMGVITDEMIANDLGVDIEDVYAQRDRERKLREHYGLPEPVQNNVGGAPGQQAEASEDDDADRAR